MCDPTKIREAARRAHDTANFYRLFADDCAFNYRPIEEAEAMEMAHVFNQESQHLNALADRLDNLLREAA